MIQKVAQTQPAVPVLEKDTVIMDCVYETMDPSYSLFWYKQPPDGEVIFLAPQDSYSECSATEGLCSLSFYKTAKSIKLTITASQLSDSAVFLCALREGTMRRNLQGP